MTNLDKLTYAGNLENLKDVENEPRYHFAKGDIADRELLDKLLGQGFAEDHCRALDLVIQQGKPHSLITFVADRPGHDRRYALETSKTDRQLGWRPAIPLEEGLRETVQWYIQDKSWWQRMRVRG